MAMNDLVSMDKQAELTRRYHGLDAARASAMLLGVFYHLPIAFMGGGFFGGPPSPKMAIDNWLHSYRMPMFFMISGFFASMMLAKYGLGKYLVRRWWRIGAALFVSFALLVCFRFAVERFQGQATPFGGFGAPVPGAGPAGQPSPFGGFGPPAPGMPVPGAGPVGQVGPPRGASPGGPPAAGFPNPAFPGFAPPAPTLNNAGNAPGIAAPVFPGGFQFPPMPSARWSIALFGDASRHLRLEHLWFLWYLLVMISVAPLVVRFAAFVGAPVMGPLSRASHQLLRWNVAALALAIVTLPALIHARGFMGWSLMNPQGFSGTFPDFMFQYYADMSFYGLYFIAGWWLFRCRTELSSLEQKWKWSLAIGIFGFWASQWLSGRYANSPDAPHYFWIRLAGFGLYGLGTAYSAFGFLGFFERFLNRPTSWVRYLADTALWVYLIHLPLIPYVIGWVEPSRTSWWEATAGGMLLVTGICLALYELVVRPTPLIYLYGPANPGKSRKAEA